MKLLRYGPPGKEKPGLLDDGGRIRDLSQHTADINAAALSPERLAALAALGTGTLPLVEGSPRLGPPVAGVGNILAIGYNYADHVAETKARMPKEPLVFNKTLNCLAGPNDPVIIPKGAKAVDWEVELAVVVGRKAQYVPESRALDHVAGYAIMDDISERDYQKDRGGQFVKGKSFDSFGPLGPWLVTKDEVKDPQKLHLWQDVNGVRRQDGSTRSMIFSVAFLVAHLSEFMTLMPGDVITTGTPPGVGLGMKPPLYLKPGDVLRLGVEGLGEQQHKVVAWEERP
jgi:2-keto-4-pentenoate hydratase/2-oxohepta-3-ene-1,7-dioic acid hydratase in catechol pathway